MKLPTVGELSCLVAWPTGTNGEVEDLKMIVALLELADKYGFGRVAQTAQAIEEITRDRTNIAKYERLKETRFAMLKWPYTPPEPIKEVDHKAETIGDIDPKSL